MHLLPTTTARTHKNHDSEAKGQIREKHYQGGNGGSHLDLRPGFCRAFYFLRLILTSPPWRLFFRFSLRTRENLLHRLVDTPINQWADGDRSNGYRSTGIISEEITAVVFLRWTAAS